jgi:hypothetical protein
MALKNVQATMTKGDLEPHWEAFFAFLDAG